MSKKFLIRMQSFVGLFLLLVISCNNPETDAAKTDTPDSAAVVAPAGAPGKLDTLWMEAGAFAALNQRLTFRFYVAASSFTLHGWLGTNFNNKPADVKLSTGRQSPILYGVGSYFGNLQLSPNDLNAIQRVLTSTNSKYVVFGPSNPTTGSDAGQIVYNVFVAKDDPGNLSPGFVHKFLVDPTGISTNPSPPKNSE